MKLVTYKVADGSQLGIAAEDGSVLPLVAAYRIAGVDTADIPQSMLDLIERYEIVKDDLAKAAKSIQDPKARLIAAAEIEWLPPLKNPSKIFGCAINNASLNKLASNYPQNPPFFVKVPSALTGHRQPIVVRPDYGLTHPEGELAVVIGRRCKMVTPEEALKYVFGYTIINDVTSITLKSEDTYVFPQPDIDPPPPGFEHGAMQLAYHARSKNTDTFGPIGPWIVTADDIPDPNALTVKVYMGDEECTSDSTGGLRFKIQEVISWASRYFTLEPGDIIHMGTAAKGKYGLRELDFQSVPGPCSIEISGIGKLTNPIKRVDMKGNAIALEAKGATKAVWPPRNG